MNRIALAIRHILRSGHAISWWSFAVSVVLAATVMAPDFDRAAPVAAIAAMVVAWACFAAGLVVIAVAERTARFAGIRSRIVVAGVVVLAATRPLVLDAVSSAFAIGHAPVEALPFRVMTNVIVWAVALTATALIAGTTHSLSHTNAQLSAVIAELDASQERVAALRARAVAAVAAAATELRAHVAELRAHPASEAVAPLAEQIRFRSHRLAELADAPLEGRVALAALASLTSPRAEGGARHLRRLRHDDGAPRRGVLRVPPPGVVAVLYLACMLPYAALQVTPLVIVTALVLVVGGGFLVDRICRTRRVARRRSRGPAVFLALSVMLGIALSVVTAALGAELAPAVVPALAYVGLAIGAVAVSGLVHALRSEQHRLSAAVAAEQRSVRMTATPTRDAVRVAAELLHRDGQGVCTVFGLQHPPGNVAAPAALATLADELDELSGRVARVFDDAAPSLDTSSIDELVSTWRRVMLLTHTITPAARAALDTDRMSARVVYEVVAEGLLNAVKHGGGAPTEVRIDLIATGAGSRVRVEVRTSRPVEANIELRGASHIRSLGARLRSTAAGAVLEATIGPLAAPAAGSVVSAEHPPEGAATPS